MANKKQQKQQKRLYKDQHRKKYRVLKELRWWLAGFLAICIIVTVVAAIPNNTSVDMDTVVLSGGETEVDLTAFSYYFYRDYYNILDSENFIRDYGSFGLDPKKPLSESEYTSLRSYFEHFVTERCESVAETVRYAELARTNGLTLDAEDKKAVEAEVDKLKSAAMENGQTLELYLDKRYAPNMTEEDLRAAISLYKLAEKQHSLSFGELTACNDAEIDMYYESHKSELTTLDYAMHKFSAPTHEEVVEMIAPFLECENETEFLDLVETDIRAQGANDLEVDNYLKQQCVQRLDRTATGEFPQWAFDDARAKADTHVIYYGEGKNACEVYFIIRPSGKLEIPSRNARSILISGQAFKTAEEAKAKALEVYDLVRENGTEEYFAQVAKEQSYEQDTASYGGEREGIVPGDVIAVFEAWLFDDERQVGDIGIVESDGDYHIIYYKGTGDPCWKVTTKNALVEERVEKFTKKLESDVPTENKESFILANMPDDLAVGRNGTWFNFFVVSCILSLLAFAATAWCFIETIRLKKKYGYQ